MTLDPQQRHQTSVELKANYEIAGVTPEDIAADLGHDADWLDETINLTPTSRREAVWALRDYLEDRIRKHGREPVPYTWLRRRPSLRLLRFGSSRT